MRNPEESSAPHPYLRDVARPRVFAHRGLVLPDAARAGVSENTRAAFAAARAAGARFIESDCHLSADGEVVLFHDADLTRVAGDPRAIAEVSHVELAAIMEARGGLLTLAQALDEFPDLRFNIDVKAAAAAAPAGRSVAPHAERVLLTSFSDRIRRRALSAASDAGPVRAQHPATSPGRSGIVHLLLALASRSSRRIASAFDGLDALQIPERQGRMRILTPRLLSEAHRHGVEVHVWTVNDPARMVELARLGVDGIVTDRADLAIEAFGEMQP